MTERELKKLSRADLLEMMLALSKENEQLREQLAQTQQQLADRAIAIDKAGSLAEAALRLNGVFEAAQAACEQYTQNIRQLSERQAQVCAKMERETEAKCAEMERKAQAECDKMLKGAKKQAAPASESAAEKRHKLDDSYSWLSEFLDSVPEQSKRDENK